MTMMVFYTVTEAYVATIVKMHTFLGGRADILQIYMV